MGTLEVYENLKRIFWLARVGKISLDSVELLVLDRSSTSGVKRIQLNSEAVLLKDRVISSSSQIPLHRILEIWVGGRCVWRRER
ncbi:MAG: RNA repair domain-containing protein [Desulfurococcaceae archaeon]|nr:RNA repair domain-containing protein [Desulfurococcaceae archaeon]